MSGIIFDCNRQSKGYGRNIKPVFSDVVAKVVLKAVTSENPNLRYLAGKDVEKLMEVKRGMSDEEVHEIESA
jgi:hypothetical protein